MEPATATFRLSVCPGMGSVKRFWHDATHSVGMPCASLPTTRSMLARSSSCGFWPPLTTRAHKEGRFGVSTNSCQDNLNMFAVPTLPALACTAFGPHGSVPSTVTMVFFPMATADRMRVPILPGSATRASTRPGHSFVATGGEGIANMHNKPLGELQGLILCITVSLTTKALSGSVNCVVAVSIASVAKTVRGLWPDSTRAVQVRAPSAINLHRCARCLGE